MADTIIKHTYDREQLNKERSRNKKVEAAFMTAFAKASTDFHNSLSEAAMRTRQQNAIKESLKKDNKQIQAALKKRREERREERSLKRQQNWKNRGALSKNGVSSNGGFRNKKYSIPQSKVILGKIRRIYKIAGSRKEYIKYKKELIAVSDYKKLMKLM